MISDDLVASYRAQGFVHVPQVLSEEEVTAFRAASDKLLDSDAEIWAGGDDGEKVEVDYVTQAWRKDETLRGLALHPSITAIARKLAGAPLRLYSSEVLVKDPNRALPTLIHDDEAGLPMAGLDRTLTAWVALVDVPVERGCLSYVPGSHLRDESARLKHMTSFEHFRHVSEVWPEFRWQPRVTVPLRAGDVAFHHCRTVHMAGANESDERRTGHGIIYVDAGVTYRPGVMDEYLAHMEPGQALDDAELFPLIPA